MPQRNQIAGGKLRRTMMEGREKMQECAGGVVIRSGSAAKLRQLRLQRSRSSGTNQRGYGKSRRLGRIVQYTVQ